MEPAHQIPGFHFRIVFKGLKGSPEYDMQFQSISGIGVELENNKDDDSNDPKAKSQLQTRYPPLLLTRGVVPIHDSPLLQWFSNAFSNSQCSSIEQVDVELLNENHEPVMIWSLYEVYPKSWRISELNAMRSEIVIESIELTYSMIEINVTGGKSAKKSVAKRK
jgi:phage tail-like protein